MSHTHSLAYETIPVDSAAVARTAPELVLSPPAHMLSPERPPVVSRTYTTAPPIVVPGPRVWYKQLPPVVVSPRQGVITNTTTHTHSVTALPPRVVSRTINRSSSPSPVRGPVRIVAQPVPRQVWSSERLQQYRGVVTALCRLGATAQRRSKYAALCCLVEAMEERRRHDARVHLKNTARPLLIANAKLLAMAMSSMQRYCTMAALGWAMGHLRAQTTKLVIVQTHHKLVASVASADQEIQAAAEQWEAAQHRLRLREHSVSETRRLRADLAGRAAAHRGSQGLSRVIYRSLRSVFCALEAHASRLHVVMQHAARRVILAVGVSVGAAAHRQKRTGFSALACHLSFCRHKDALLETLAELPASGYRNAVLRDLERRSPARRPTVVQDEPFRLRTDAVFGSQQLMRSLTRPTVRCLRSAWQDLKVFRGHVFWRRSLLARESRTAHAPTVHELQSEPTRFRSARGVSARSASLTRGWHEDRVHSDARDMRQEVVVDSRSQRTARREVQSTETERLSSVAAGLARLTQAMERHSPPKSDEPAGFEDVWENGRGGRWDTGRGRWETAGDSAWETTGGSGGWRGTGAPRRVSSQRFLSDLPL
mmetsp:Transcript_34739/g.83965  ORF Transcript_34739/g.83965 Transcript_34739/m.83965 type:complete len:597 (+) Transcript_34739:22-1812(+)